MSKHLMPLLAAHCILTHTYALPEPFRDAILRCPPKRSQAYFQAFADNAPKRYADLARKHLAPGG